MKVLWITNILFPETMKLLGKSDSFQSSGGWLLGMSEAVTDGRGIALTVAAVSGLVKDLTFLKGEKINYYVLPYGKGNINYNSEYEMFWKEIEKEVKPDIVHIHGTEFTHGLSYIRACGNRHVVVSIQGLASQIAKYYYGGLSKWEILKNVSVLNFLRNNHLFRQQSLMSIRGKWEEEMIRSVNHIIGRTNFDHSHSMILNPNIQYYHCNETLRKEFYSGCWTRGKARTRTIFISLSDSSIKGLHMVLKSLTIIRKQYPDVMLRITGEDFTKGKCLSNYGRIIKQIIKKNNLTSNITFLGKLNAQQMRMEYLQASVFVCASSIENSSNSISEAQILGVPCIASYVGGTPSLIQNELCGEMYRYEDFEMLAYLIIRAFNTPFDNSYVRKEALKRHDPLLNVNCIVNIYNDILNQ